MDSQPLLTICLLLLLFSSMWPHVNLASTTFPQKNSEGSGSYIAYSNLTRIWRNMCITRAMYNISVTVSERASIPIGFCADSYSFVLSTL